LVTIWDYRTEKQEIPPGVGTEVDAIRHTVQVSGALYLYGSSTRDKTVLVQRYGEEPWAPAVREGEPARGKIGAVSPNRTRIATRKVANEVCVWDVGTGKATPLAVDDAAGNVKMSFSPDGSYLATNDGGRVFDSATGQELLAVSRLPMADFVISSDGSRMATAHSSGEVSVWDPRPRRAVIRLDGPSRHQSPVRCLAFDRSGARLVTGDDEENARIWDATTGDNLHAQGEINKSKVPLLGAVFHRDGTRVSFATGKEGVLEWEYGRRQATVRVDEVVSPMYSTVALGPDGLTVAGFQGLKGPAVRVRGAGSDSGVFLKGHKEATGAVAFSADGSRIVTASDDRTIRVWEVASGRQLVAPLEGPAKPTAIAFDRDGHCVAVASNDGAVRVWDLTTRKRITMEWGQTGAVSGVAFSKSGERLAAATLDGTVRVWDTRTGLETLALRGEPGDAFVSVAFSPDGHRLAAGSGKGSVLIWDGRPKP